MSIAESVVRARRTERLVVRVSVVGAQVHPFDPDPKATVRSQCMLCYGWYDDPRHLMPRPRRV